MLAYRDVETFVSEGLAKLGYGSANPDTGEQARTMPVINPGPGTIAALTKLTPGPLVFLTVGNGAGLELEQTYDQVFLTVRCLGQQNDYDFAERLAYDIDEMLLKITGTADGTIGAARVLYVTRTGSAPQLTDFDASNRYHFQTTYIIPTATGL